MPNQIPLQPPVYRTQRKFQLAFILIFYASTTLSFAQTHKIVLIDGQYQQVPIQTTVLSLSKPHDPFIEPKKPTTEVATTSSGALLLLFNEIRKTTAWYQESSRADDARRTAQERAEQAARTSGNAFTLVPWTTRDPLRLPTEFNQTVQVNTYEVRNPISGNDLHELRKAIFGPIQDELNPAGAKAGERGYLSGVALATSTSNGIEVRLLDREDEKKYVIEESKRIESIEIERREKAEQEIKEAQVREAKLVEEERQKRANDYAKEQKEREQKAEAAAKRENELKASRAELEKRYKERDEACKAGRTADCVYVDDKLTNDIDKAVKNQVLARCMQDTEGGQPLKGPCAKDGPGCMYCQPGKQLDRQVRFESFTALQVQSRTKMIKIGKIPSSGLDKLVNAQLSTPNMLDKYGLHEFVLKKP